MIRFIKRKNLDVLKYDYCIENSIQSTIYAYSWYLDIVADNWSVLVLNDYETVMPVPWKRKFGIKFVVKPPFCQQLGVFSLREFSLEEGERFWRKIPFNYIKHSYSFKQGDIDSGKFELRDNYLKINKKEKALSQLDISLNRIRDYKKAEKNALEFIPDLDREKFLEFVLEEQIKKKKIKDSVFFRLKQMMNLDLIKVNGVLCKGELVSACLWGCKGDTVWYLYPLSSEVGKKTGASTFLIINTLLEKGIEKIDFEGSMIEGVARFYKSFNSVKTQYVYFEHALLKFLK